MMEICLKKLNLVHLLLIPATSQDAHFKMVRGITTELFAVAGGC
jgi:hypothetical protein